MPIYWIIPIGAFIIGINIGIGLALVAVELTDRKRRNVN